MVLGVFFFESASPTKKTYLSLVYFDERGRDREFLMVAYRQVHGTSVHTHIFLTCLLGQVIEKTNDEITSSGHDEIISSHHDITRFSHHVMTR